MFHLDNGSGIDVMPPQKQTISRQQKWFTEGDTQTPPSYPGADWFNIVQAELLNVLSDGGITPDKSKLNQLSGAIKNIINKNQKTIKFNSSTDSSSETEAATPLAVKKVNDLATENHKKISNVIDKFTFNDNESIVFSPNHNYHIAMRHDGVCGVYNHLTNKFSWLIDKNGGIDGYIGCDRIVGLDDYVQWRSLPVGIPQPWPTTTPPDGWLKCNGWKFDKNKYPKLAQVYPSGYLPDLRGEFIRGWDDGKGTDTGRGILSWQEDAIRNIYGEFAGLQQYSSGVFNHVANGQAYAGLTNNNWDKAIYAFNASNVVPTSHENRPRNLAFMYILKAE